MRKKKQNFTIPLVVYPFDVMVSLNETDQELIKKLKGLGIAQDDIDLVINLPKSCQGRCATFNSGQTIIRLKDQPYRHWLLSYASHEIFHAVVFIMQRTGMKLEPTVSCEAYAYLIGYLSKEIFARI